MRLSQLLFDLAVIAVFVGMFALGVITLVELFAKWLATIIVGL
jgi:hypothetical protein